MMLTVVIFVTILSVSFYSAKYIAISPDRLDPYSNVKRRGANILAGGVFPIVMTALLVGLRYDVGVDWGNYMREFQGMNANDGLAAGLESSRMEWLYVMLMYFLKALGLPYYSIFICSSLICLTLYYASFSDKKWLLSWGVFALYTLDTFYLFLNIMRQCIAFFIILYGIKFIIHRKPLRYIICIIIAAGFHKTSYILLPFYLFSYIRKPILTGALAVGAYVFTWLGGMSLFNTLLNLVTPALEGEYSSYAQAINVLEMEKGSGLGMLALHMIDILLIVYAAKCHNLYSKRWGYDIFYNLFFCGVLIQNVAGMNMLLARLPLCLTSMRLIVTAFTLYLSFHSSSYKIDRIFKQSNQLYRAGGIAIIILALAYFAGNCMAFDYKFI
ncbi:EpsG family protein [Bacteroides acidifaciens]|jgi:hypothetical protein|uniref:EpsG family protein n=1 Tax=Bacteroides acidifaciens TaxID=85831 RepID=UPI00259B37F1|nr:EpsG family protein [Bacteroides acidifaciens]